MRIAYLDCFSGISGDMLLGAFVDAGVPLEKLADVASSLNVGARLEARKVMRGGLTGTKVDVRTGEDVLTGDSGHLHEHSHVHTHERSHASGQVHSHPHEHAHDHPHGHDHPHQHDHL